MPDKPAILTYWSPQRREFYQGQLVDALADEFPDITFYVVGSDGKDEPQHPNMKYLGWQEDLEDVYQRVSILLRMPKHDGKGSMVLEMLARGRWVIRSIEFPHTELATDLQEARAALRRCLAKSGMNDTGREYVLQHFSPQLESERIKPIYRQILVGQK